jgi:hypothetical protein
LVDLSEISVARYVRPETIVGRHLGVPYDVDHFYMPLVSAHEVAESGVYRQLVMPEDEFDWGTITHFMDLITPFIRDDLKRHDEVKSLGLGLGYGEPENYIYDAVIRSHRPDVIIEIGSGISTYYARNATDARIICIEPYPCPGFPEWCRDNNVELLALKLQDAIGELPLGHNILLFIDSTHVCKITSELHLVFTHLLPRLQGGNLIHFHDIFLPFPCLRPTHNSFSQTVNWYESVMLGVFLQASQQYETVLPQYWMGHSETGAELLRRIPFYARTAAEGSSYWIRKRP